MAASEADHVLGDRRLRDLDAQLLKLPVNPRRAPQGVRLGHLSDKARISGATAGRPGPFRRLFQVQKSLKPDRCQRMTVAGWTMEMPSAAAPQAGQQDPEQPVGRPQAWARRGTLEDGQLVPQCEVLEHQGALGPDPAEEAGEDEGDHAGHHRSGRPKVNADEVDGVSRRHRYVVAVVIVVEARSVNHD